MEPVTVLFDADCTLCQRVRGYGDGHGKPGMLRFLANTEEEGQRLLARHGLAGREKETLVAVVGERAFTESAAVVQVA
ncbi:MAG TPA: DCC1-like thiol-disulfide oxidoreductase family protein, partial [Candidatus Thermoplasmatota archaeon]|nr:DCC1-like thiol-disulfide oxidoreductase family protein [Candidatus Thermoplasmatota archaeon]